VVRLPLSPLSRARLLTGPPSAVPVDENGVLRHLRLQEGRRRRPRRPDPPRRRRSLGDPEDGLNGPEPGGPAAQFLSTKTADYATYVCKKAAGAGHAGQIRHAGAAHWATPRTVSASLAASAGPDMTEGATTQRTPSASIRPASAASALSITIVAA
jgi:hypothetical protein